MPNVPLPEHRNLYWEHENGRQSLRLVLDRAGTLIGVNVMGLRYRHEVCERWIREAWPVSRVLDDLATANFDTEFFRRHEPAIARAVREQMA